MATSEVDYNCEYESIEDRSEEESEEGSEQLEDNGCSEELDVGSQETLLHREVRSVYLITYSQADLDKFPTRDSFARTVVRAFDETRSGLADIVQWVCSQERHSSGGTHYHMAVKLSHARRWLRVRNYLDDNHSIQVNFSSVHSNYYSAWRYTTKEDSEYVQSVNHPDLVNSAPPRTQEASVTTTERGGTKRTAKKTRKRKAPRLSIFDVSKLVVAKGIKSRLELLALASRQMKEGKEDLAQFIANRGSKVVDEAIQVGWEMEEAEEKLKRKQMTRMEILHKALEGPCIANCNGEWLDVAEDTLARNNLSGGSFQSAVRELLEKGRGKYRDILIFGSANCGKTFLLNPLNVIYNTFTNPATSNFAWVGAESAEVLFLNDFRWSPQVLPWHDMLLLLEGQTVYLPTLKCHYAKDIVFETDTSIFCTGKHELVFIKGGCIDERETEMMRVRWRIFNFFSQIPHCEQRNVPPCPRCFAKLILCSNNNNNSSA